MTSEVVRELLRTAGVADLDGAVARAMAILAGRTDRNSVVEACIEVAGA